MLTRELKTRELKSCRLCGGPDIPVVLDLGVQALSGHFPGATATDVPCAPLHLVKCADCGLVQIRHQVDPGILYHAEYGYRSGINATMRDHLAGIVRQIERLVTLAPGDAVLDIASNDGTLLGNYSTPGLVRVGIDPSIRQFGKYYDKGIVKVADFFSAAKFRSACPDTMARVITSIAVFYDLESPHDFVAGIAEILAEDGVWVLEQCDIGMMLEAGAFDAICHEHLEYYALRQIRRFVEDHGLRVFDMELNESNGGSARMFVCHGGGPYRENRAAIERAEARERTLRLDAPDTLAAFGAAIQDLRRRLVRFISAEREAGRTFHVYGASTKGNVMLQYCGITASMIDCAAERNPDKWGKLTPGTRIPIVSEEESRKAAPDYYLVLPWHFRDEFIARERDHIARGGRLLFPLPELEVYPPLNGTGP